MHDLGSSNVNLLVPWRKCEIDSIQCTDGGLAGDNRVWNSSVWDVPPESEVAWRRANDLTYHAVKSKHA